MLTLTLALYGFQVVQPVPTPTPLSNALTPVAPTSNIDFGALLREAWPYVLAGLSLLYAFTRSKMNISEQREDFMAKMANQALELGQRANRSADNADKASAAAVKAEGIAARLTDELKNIRTELANVKRENVMLKSTVEAQDSEIKTLKKQVEDLTATGRTSRDELKEKDAEIKRLNAELYRMASAAVPAGYSLPQFTHTKDAALVPETVQKMEIVNTEDNPVPTVDAPAKDK